MPPSPPSGAQKTTQWLKYFDVIMVGCAKPSFFQHRAPLFSVDVNTGGRVGGSCRGAQELQPGGEGK